MPNINIQKATKNKNFIQNATFYIASLFEQDLILHDEKEQLLQTLLLLSTIDERQEKIILNNVLEDNNYEN